jgi:hypothetical protein
MSKTALDLIVAVSLAVALLLVVGLDKILPPPKTTTAKLEEVTPQQPPPRVKKLRLAVSQTANPKEDWDNMGGLLKGLGEGYQFTQIPILSLYDPKTFDDIDVFFFTCSRDGNDQAVANNLRKFVARGGTLYASDWHYQAVALAFPDMVGHAKPGEGLDQSLVADVVDPGLKDALGTANVPLRFDLDHWKTAAFGSDRVKVLMKAKYVTQEKQRSETPLLVKFGFDKGTVIFTSFHNEAQNSELETKLLKYLVFSAVTAHIENEAQLTMLKGGFSPQKSNLFSASGKSEIANVYQSKKAGKVRFVLGFEGQNVRLKLTVTSPDGKKREETGTSTIVIEQSCPRAGAWQYTVEAIEVPFPDFPFTLTVGESS